MTNLVSLHLAKRRTNNYLMLTSNENAVFISSKSVRQSIFYQLKQEIYAVRSGGLKKKIN